MRFNISSATDIGKKSTNQDAYLINKLIQCGDCPNASCLFELCLNEEGLTIAVSDGIGGASQGNIAAKLTLEYTHAHLDTLNTSWEDMTALGTYFNKMNETVVSHFHKQKTTGGTTVALAALQPTENDRLHIRAANIGDSVSFLLREGVCIPLSVEHTLGNAKRILNLQPSPSDENSLLHYVGNSSSNGAEQVYIDTSNLFWHEDDILITCTDGVSKKLSPAQLLALPLQNTENAARYIIECIKNHANPQERLDNMTVVVVKNTNESSTCAL